MNKIFRARNVIILGILILILFVTFPKLFVIKKTEELEKETSPSRQPTSHKIEIIPTHETASKSENFPPKKISRSYSEQTEIPVVSLKEEPLEAIAIGAESLSHALV